MTENRSKKPRIVRVVSDETLEAWEQQRAEYLKEHPAEAMKPVRDELVREAIGASGDEEAGKESGERLEEKLEEEEELRVDEETLEELKQEAEEEKEEGGTESEAENGEGEAKKEKRSPAEEEKEEEKAEEKEESRVEVEKPVEEKKKEKGKPKIKMITEPVVKPTAIEKMEAQASRDVWPSAPQQGAPITLEQASKEVRAEEARRLWRHRQEEKKRKLGFFGKMKAALGFR